MAPRILCLVNHYFGPSPFVGRSTSEEPDRRRDVVQRTLQALRSLPWDVDVQVCGMPGRSLVPMDRDFSHVEDPRHLPYATIESLVDHVEEYDWFLDIEDDVLVDTDALRLSMEFTGHSEVNEVLLPHRVEKRPDGTDYALDLEAVPGWRGLHREHAGLDLDVAVNVHAGLALLSRDQLRYAAERCNLARREKFHGGLMASALANLHAPFLVWRATDVGAHQVVHLDEWLESPAVVPADVGPVTEHGGVDAIVVDGLALEVHGWASSPDGVPIPVEAARFGATTIEPVAMRRLSRADVPGREGQPLLDAGFVAHFSVLDLAGSDLLEDRFAVLAREDGRRVALTREVRWPALSASSAAQDVPEIPDEPSMPPEGIARLRELLTTSRGYLEYGSGGSTMLARRSPVPQVVSIESDLSWLVAVRARIPAEDRGRIDLRYVDVGRTGDWGTPVDESGWRGYDNYAMDVWRHGWPGGGSPDVVLIDGRFRVACFAATLLHTAPGTVVLFDDYETRVGYHVAEHLVERVASHGRTAEFVVPTSVPRDVLWNALIESLADPQ